MVRKRKAHERNGDVPRTASTFYEKVLSEADRAALADAREVSGLDEEIALLRLRLARMLQEHPQDMELLVKGMGLLVRAVATRYRLSKKSEKDLQDSVVGVIRGIGNVLYPEGIDGDGKE